MRKKRFVIGIIALLLLLVAAIVICDQATKNTAKGRLYSKAENVPFNKVGLLLGTAKQIAGRENPFYTYRIQAAYSLLKAGRIKYLVISGDNSRRDYNEPGMMRADLLQMGIDSSVIYPDYAGFNTRASMIRLKEVFGQDSVTVISQKFHNERAIYIAQHAGIKAIGFNAQDVTGAGSFRTRAREKLARVKMVLYIWLKKKPKYSGPKITIPD